MRRLLPSRAVAPDPDGGPCRHLAVRVIELAFRDLASSAGLRRHQESARVFLAGSSMLDHWCAVADLDPAWMVARANRLTTASGGQEPFRTMGTRED
jgi:hypothetical protein